MYGIDCLHAYNPGSHQSPQQNGHCQQAAEEEQHLQAKALLSVGVEIVPSFVNAPKIPVYRGSGACMGTPWYRSVF